MKATNNKKSSEIRENLALLQAMTLELYHYSLELSNIVESEIEENRTKELEPDETEPGSPEVEPGQG